MSRRTSRRNFIKASAAGGVGFWVAGGVQAAPSKSALETVNFASVGVGGKGTSDSNDAAKHGNMVAICDIDENNLNKAASKWPKAKKFFDYRKMIEEMGSSIDAVTVSTPDHSHGPASALALKAGKHCFTQKPMSHSIHEARVLGELAKKQGVKTQMGNQGTANSTLRESAALIQGGAIGTVKEVHVWTNRPVWPQGAGRPKAEPPVPKHIHWKEFLGPAKARAYHPAYHPFKWRGWWDFGTGALGDMGCHIMDMPYWALELKHPTRVEADSEGNTPLSAPTASTVRYHFPAGKYSDALQFSWYDGGRMPAAEVLAESGMTSKKVAGTFDLVMVGDKGKMFFNRSNLDWLITPDSALEDFKAPEPSLPRVANEDVEWVEACKGGAPALSRFEKSGPFTETVLLGNLAIRLGEPVEWDGPAMKAVGCPRADRYIHRDYRRGWKLD